MSGTFDAVRVKINTLIQAAFAANHPGTKVAFENVKFTQPKNAAWVHVAYQPNLSRRMEIGNNNRMMRHMGVVIINIFVPEDTGTKTLNDMRETAFNAVADATYSLGEHGYLKLCYAEQRNRGALNGYLAYNVQVEYYHDAPFTG